VLTGAFGVRADAGRQYSYTEWKDPIEGAFAMQVPAGWKVTGGMYQFAPVDVRLQVDAGSPDGAVHLRIGDASLTTFVAPGPSSRVRGLHEGQSYDVNGVTYTILHPMSGEQFSRYYVESKLAKVLTGLKIGESRNRPDVATALGQPLAGGATLGETEFTFSRGGHAMHGACYVRIDPGMGGIFVAGPSVALAPANELDAASGALEHMTAHTKLDAQWQAKKTDDAVKFKDKILRDHDATMRELHQQYEKCISRINATAALWKPILNPPGY
jgi:hypothetical protein